MIIENGDSKFTEEEKQNLVVREYTSEEIEKNKKAYVNKSTKKCFPLIVLIVLCSICSYILPAMSYAVVVDKKLPIEVESRDAGASDDSCMIYHYPVEGRDSTSGYASIFYIGKEKYENAEVGEKIRITQC